MEVGAGGEGRRFQLREQPPAEGTLLVECKYCPLCKRLMANPIRVLILVALNLAYS